MEKWNVKATNDFINLGDFSLDVENIKVFVDVLDMSENLRAEINKVIEIEKRKITEERKLYNEKNGTNRETEWSNKPVVFDFIFLQIVLSEKEQNNYSIEFGFHDVDNDILESWENRIEIDLSDYQEELKKIVIKSLVNKFF